MIYVVECENTNCQKKTYVIEANTFIEAEEIAIEQNPAYIMRRVVTADEVVFKHPGQLDLFEGE